MNAILEALYNHAQHTPERVAFFGQNANQASLTLTYQELFDRVNQAADKLKQLAPECLALRAENTLDWVIIDLAAMQAGVTIVPVPTFFSPSQVEHTLNQAGVDLLVGEWSEQEKAIAQIEALSVYRIFPSSYSKRLAETSKITFTSGSTGTPKGVCLSDENLVKVAQSLASAIDAKSDTHLVLLPLSTLLENVTGVYVPLLLGVTSAIFPGDQVGLMGSSQFDPAIFARALAVYQPNSLVLTPALLIALIHIAKAQPALAAPLQFVAVGGARVAPELMAAAHQLSIPAYEGYGLSECASVVCLNTPKASLPGSCGKVLDHVAIRLADDGELQVKGNTALGYLGQPFTEEWLATGDLAEIDENGFVHLLGRKKNQIITSFGRNVSPEWVESQALAFFPGKAFIVTGEAQSALTAIIEPQEKMAEKVALLNATLPDYARIQRLIVVDDLKSHRDWFTPNGRFKRAIIEAWVQDFEDDQPTACQLIELQQKPQLNFQVTAYGR